jgi:hypothetical protein
MLNVVRWDDDGDAITYDPLHIHMVPLMTSPVMSISTCRLNINSGFEEDTLTIDYSYYSII